jgi:hypothetical protein
MACRGGSISTGGMGCGNGLGTQSNLFTCEQLKASGWVASCERVRGEGSLIWATRAGIRWSGIKAAPINSEPEPNSWAHYDASAWTAAWLTVRGRAMIAPREMLLRPEWRGQVEWREHYEPRKRGHRPDLAVRLASGGVLPVEVELTDKSPARLKAVLALHRQWVLSGLSSGVIYVCANQRLAERVRATGEDAKLSIERGTFRIELLDSIKRQALDARGGAAAQDWSTLATEAAA